MTTQFNENGGLEVSPGPRGFSVNGVEVSQDGTTAYFTTDQPGTLNGIPLPRGPKGNQGDYGDPGEARIRVDETVGYRLFLWDTATAGENMVYGDTGVRRLADGTLFRRLNNMVETDAADPTTLPAGFRPITGLDRIGTTYSTTEDWPTALTGVEHVAPVTGRGLEGYQAAIAQGYPGTAEEWMNLVYRVVLPPEGVPGQVLTRTAEGSDWLNPPHVGPSPWVNITLTSNWASTAGQAAQVRLNNGTVEMIGEVVYTGPEATAGIWEADFIRIGVVPPAYAPEAIYEVPVRGFRGVGGSGNTRVVMVLQIHNEGQINLGAFVTPDEPNGVPMLSGHVKIGLGALPSYAVRNS